MKEIISYVIRTKNEGKYLKKTCQQIRKQRGDLEHEIIIVDSGSVDNTLDIAYEYADKVIKIMPDEFTWGYALNKGIEETKGTIICLLSGHCFIEETPDSVWDAYKFLNDSEYVCLYGMQKGDIHVDKMEAIELAEIFPDVLVESTECSQIPGVSSACCMFKKKIWDIYKFNEIVQSAEDGIWYHELVTHGYKAVYYPKFKVIHAHPFQIEYMYTKWYWRIYESEIILGRNKKWKTSNIFRFAMSFIKGMTKKCNEFYECANMMGIKTSRKVCRKYFFLRECATFQAKYNLKKKKNCSMKYAEFKVPNYLKRFERFVGAGEFYEI